MTFPAKHGFGRSLRASSPCYQLAAGGPRTIPHSSSSFVNPIANQRFCVVFCMNPPSDMFQPTASAPRSHQFVCGKQRFDRDPLSGGFELNLKPIPNAFTIRSGLRDHSEILAQDPRISSQQIVAIRTEIPAKEFVGRSLQRERHEGWRCRPRLYGWLVQLGSTAAITQGSTGDQRHIGIFANQLHLIFLEGDAAIRMMINAGSASTRRPRHERARPSVNGHVAQNRQPHAPHCRPSSQIRSPLRPPIRMVECGLNR